MPYPFFIEPDGSVGKQEFWKGDPAKLIGFAKRIDRHEITLPFAKFWKQPGRCLGMYPVFADSKDEWSTYGDVIASIDVDEEGILS